MEISLSRLLSFLVVIFAAAPVAALVQPGTGVQIPEGNNLVNFLNGEGESIDPLTQAAITPQTFNPSCNLTFKVIGRGAGQRNSFGWYNVTGSKPARSDLHEFLTCSDGVGTVKSLDIAQDPAYRGGEIGFFMASTQTRNANGSSGGGTMSGNCVQFVEGAGPTDASLGFLYYSEPQWNDDNIGEDSYIHLLIMDSGVYPEAFYFGWEDLFGGGDNDFEDILTRVEGITCSGGGADCDTGLPGICGAGTMQCRDGRLACVAQMEPRSFETCNGLDDDCDGVIDNDAECGDGQICHRGACVAKCFRGEFACLGDLVCDDGVCVEPACDGVRCPSSEQCVAGACVAPCDGVTCPMGNVCRLGACVDPCSGVSCDPGSHCDAGVCKAPCGCTPCPDGTLCAADGRCLPADCADVNCEEGFVCQGGSCIDACAGAVCPSGEVCRLGACVEGDGTGGSGPGAGGTSGAGGSGGSGGVGPGAGGTSGQGGSGPGAGGSSAGPGASGDSDSGCGCTSSTSGGAGLGLLALGLLLTRRRAA